MASTQNMDRWTIELQLHMTKESKRFKSAKMFQRYKETILEILERESPEQQADEQQRQEQARENLLQMDKINDRLDSVRLTHFLGRIADNCATLGEMCLLERSLRDCLLQARRKSFRLGDNQTLGQPPDAADPMCYFCASHLEHPRPSAPDQAGVAPAPALLLPQIQFVPDAHHSQQSKEAAAAADTPPCSSGAPSPDADGPRAASPPGGQQEFQEAEQHYERAFYYQPRPFRSSTPPLPDDPAARAAFLAAGEQRPAASKRPRARAPAKTTNASSQQRARRAARARQPAAIGESSLRVEGEEELRGPLVIAESPEACDSHEDSMEEFFLELNERPPSRQAPLASTPLQDEKKKRALSAAVAALVAAGVERKPSGEYRASRMSASLQPAPAPWAPGPSTSQPPPRSQSQDQSQRSAAGSQLKRKRTAKKRIGSSVFRAAASHLDTSFANFHHYSANLADASNGRPQ